jgi:hypothetical protein
MKTGIFAVITGALLTLPAAAYAQGMPVVPYAANFAQTHLHNQLFVQPGVNAEIRRLNRAPKSDSRPSTAPVVPAARLQYRSDPGRRQANYANFVAGIAEKDAAGARSLEAVFQSTDFIAAVGQMIAPYGLTTNNVADAYTMYWINAWEASHGVVGSVETRARAQAVRRQAAGALQATPQFATATDAQKQEFAETLIIQAALISSNMGQVANDPRMSRQLSGAIRQGAKAMGLDLDAMTLTDNGFVPVKGSSLDEDLAPTPGGEGATEVAAAVDAPPPAPTTAKASTPPYILMAAAGGAGLAGVFLLGKVMGKKS